ncbi:hypothetical protein AHAS_Ahas15G0035200 [Arachis hypogaea]
MSLQSSQISSSIVLRSPIATISIRNPNRSYSNSSFESTATATTRVSSAGGIFSLWSASSNFMSRQLSRNGDVEPFPFASAFHNVIALVGAGVLGFSYAMSQLGWGPDNTVLVLSWICMLYIMDDYCCNELGQYAIGERLGLWIVLLQTFVMDVGMDIIYMITGGNSLKKAHQILCKDRKPIRTTYFIMIFASLSFNSIIGVSISAAVMFICLGTLAFGYAAHNVLFEIQAIVPSRPEKPSKKAMWKGLIAAYIVVGLCYFWAFENSVTDNILMSLDKPHWLTAVANIFVVIHATSNHEFGLPFRLSYDEKLLIANLLDCTSWSGAGPGLMDDVTQGAHQELKANKEELRVEKLKDKEEVEDLTHEMAELRYRTLTPRPQASSLQLK